jgi:hypothetical protein
LDNRRQVSTAQPISGDSGGSHDDCGGLSLDGERQLITTQQINGGDVDGE